MSTLKWYMYSAIVAQGARGTLLPERHSSYVIAHRPEALVEGLAVANKLGSSVHLIDPQGRIRWSAHGMGSPQDVAFLLESTKRLLAAPK